MLTYDLEARDGVPLYEYLYRRVRDDILSGALAAGERLPSKRALAEHLRVSVITVEGAYQQLEAEGYLDAPPLAAGFEKRADGPLVFSLGPLGPADPAGSLGRGASGPSSRPGTAGPAGGHRPGPAGL